jgi:dethiobiotin synthetase
MPTLFVTGSGTDIGKTHVCCRLLAALPAGLAVRCIKPVVTGFDPAAVATSDPGRLLAAQGRAIDAAGIAATSPWRFAAPISADMAAAREDRAIPFAELVEFCGPGDGTDLTLIEGIGGVMAPLDEQHTVIDWIEALAAPVLLVVGSYLGSLSHALTAFAVLRERGLDTVATVVSESARQPVPVAETAAALVRFLDPAPVSILPRDPTQNAAELAALLQKKLRLVR